MLTGKTVIRISEKHNAFIFRIKESTPRHAKEDWSIITIFFLGGGEEGELGGSGKKIMSAGWKVRKWTDGLDDIMGIYSQEVESELPRMQYKLYVEPGNL